MLQMCEKQISEKKRKYELLILENGRNYLT